MENPLIGNFTGDCLICGPAPCLYEDVSGAFHFVKDPVIIAVNDAVKHVFADYVVSLHCECGKRYKSITKNPDVKMLTGAPKPYWKEVDYLFPGCRSGATSTMSALKIAVQMGFDNIILCGAPMNGGDGYVDNFYDGVNDDRNNVGTLQPDGKLMRKYRNCFAEELDALKEHRHKLKSMSGWTAETLGKPTRYVIQ
ncbi:MAG: MucR family transcriptional regulator [Desulfobulbaceae bacterium]|nr:MucR family transcriptional regulator [Desulfobulbaceae bacterium]